MKLARIVLVGWLAGVGMLGCAGPLDPVAELPSDPDDLGLSTHDSGVLTFPAPVVQVVAGNVASFVLLADGSVWGWTDYPQPPGQLKHDGGWWSVVDARPVRLEGLDDVVSLAFRFDHACALHRDGGVSCWGANTRGQLGTGDLDWVDTPGRVEGVSGAVEIDVGEEHSCARFADSSVSCWGNRSAYWPVHPLVEGDITDTRPWRLEGLFAMSALSLSRLHTCGTTTDGELLCWGNLWPDDAAEELTLDMQLDYRDFRIAPGSGRLIHGACALLGDGSLACACPNEEAGVEPNKLPCYRAGEPVTPFASGIVDVDTRVAQACALFDDGAVRCTGSWASPYEIDATWTYDGWETIAVDAVSQVDVGAQACAIAGDCVQCWGPKIGKQPRTIGCHHEPPALPR